MKVRVAARALGAILFGLAGYQLGRWLSETYHTLTIVLTLSGAGLGVIVGLLFTPHITIAPFNHVRRWLASMAVGDLIAVAVGLIVGLVLSALVTIPLRALPTFLGSFAPLFAAVVICYISISIALSRHRELLEYFAHRRVVTTEAAEEMRSEKYLLDTSAIIDGRIADVAATGFLRGSLLVPRFVLRELQSIADSPDALRRARGRRGLDVLSQLQNGQYVSVEVVDFDLEGVEDVDGKLISIASEFSYPIVTNDYNLNKVAVLQGIKVLNINELAQALRPVLLPGEDISVRIIQEGKELDQGVGYLDDGTMVVVEGGRASMNSEVEVKVTRLLQTTAGRMIFAQLVNNGSQRRAVSKEA